MPCTNCGADVAVGAGRCGACGTAVWPSPAWAQNPAPAAHSAGAPWPSPRQVPESLTPAAHSAGPDLPYYSPPIELLPARATVGGRRRLPRLLAALGALAVAAALAGAAGVVYTHGSHGYPSHWDARIAPIATSVEELRGLTFKHPVPVNYLSVAAFEKRVTADPADVQKERKQIDEATGLFRAAGLIGANVDLATAANATQAADTIAFYDPDSKAVYVRGNGPFTIDTRVTLAHELTHVLQDQYFDLPKLQKQADDSKTGSSDAFTAIVEGDAVRIQNLYLGQQSPADQRTYARLSDQDSQAAGQRTQHIPAVVGTFFSAPYIFGPQIISVLNTTGGNVAINAALTGPTPTTRIYLDPTAVGVAPALPPIPALGVGEKKLPTYTANDDAFDDFTLYLMLSARLDRPTALRAADAFSAGSEVLYTRAGNTCFRAAVTGVDVGGNTYLRSVLTRWARTMPDAGIDSGGTPVVFHSCDPGARATTPSDAAINQATRLAASRDAIVASLVTDHVAGPIAMCAARVLVQQPNIRTQILNNKAGNADQQLRQGAAAGLACRENSLAGLP